MSTKQPESFTWRLHAPRRKSSLCTGTTGPVMHEDHLINQDITGSFNRHHQTVVGRNGRHGISTRRRTLDDYDITLGRGLQEEKIKEDHVIDGSGTGGGVRESDHAKWGHKVVSWFPDFMTSRGEEGIRHNNERVTRGYYPQRTTTTASRCSNDTSSYKVDKESQVEIVAKENKLLDWCTDGEPHTDDKDSWLEEISGEDHLLERFYAS